MDETQPWAGPPPLGEGTLLAERYLLRSVLGRGGMGDVFLAHDEVLDRPVAVKVFRPGSGTPQEQDRQRREARLLAQLSHPGLVAVFDAGVAEDAGQAFLVMELVSGPTLAERLHSGALPAAEVSSMAAQLADALAYVHAQGIVHRDVKPANILFAEQSSPTAQQPRVKLTDFGIARIVDSTRLTSHGFTVGTPNYLSPEQARGGDVGPPTDVYALGLVLLECLTGSTPFPGRGVEAVVARLHREPTVPDHLDPALAGLLSAMTRLEPQDRPSADLVAASLSGRPDAAVPDAAVPATAVLPAGSPAVGQTKVLPAAAGSTAGPRQQRLRSRGIVAAAGAAAVLLLGVGGLLVSRSLGQPAPTSPTTPASVPVVTRTVPASPSSVATPAATTTRTSSTATPADESPGRGKGNDEDKNDDKGGGKGKGKG